MVTVQAVNMRFMRTLGDIMDGYSITTEHRYILNATVIILGMGTNEGMELPK